MIRPLLFIVICLSFLISCEGASPVSPNDPGEDGPATEYVVEPVEGSTIYGQVHCGGAPVPGVPVTDGYLVTVTGVDGVYQLPSSKKNGMVYITIPSGYLPLRAGVQSRFYQPTKSSGMEVERHDFELFRDSGQENHTMLFFGDMHLADRTDDRAQFKTFTTEITSYVNSHPAEKIYAMTLGDMTWDQYWYSNNYQFENYLSDVNQIRNLTIFHTMGNHDHNMKTDVSGPSFGWETVDWDTAGRFRAALGPNYYSFNIGKIHYIVLDDIFCKNTMGGTKNDRIYEDSVVSDDINWLKQDLQYVDKSTPIFVTMHAPVYSQTGNDSLDNVSTLLKCFEGFADVTFITGHSHRMWAVAKGNIREFNSGAVCAAWWWAGHYYPTLNIGQDGSPGGYRVMTVRGKSNSSYYKATGRDRDYQFRTYDRNSILIDPSDYGVTNATYAANFRKELSDYGGYGTSSSANLVIVNVWDFGPGWNIEVTENGRPLPVSQVTTGDPLYMIAYSAPRYKSTANPTFGPSKTNHIFTVTASTSSSTLEIKVTDSTGRIYSETMKRPKGFSIDTYK